mgnify:CR=1 FL=1
MNNKLNQAVVAITGAGSGIGRALALQCAKLGAHLAISDINLEQLNETKTLVLSKQPNTQVLCTQLDVAQPQGITDWSQQVFEHFGYVNVIINNAGVALPASVEGTSKEDFEWLMNINFWGVVNGTRAFLPLLKQAPWGHVVNISSLFGLMSLPNQSAYNASKYAVRGYTESLRTEMLLEQKSIQVSCVHPGGIKTNIANKARYSGQVGRNASIEKQKKLFNERLARTTAEQAANIIITGINKNKARILVGTDAKVLDLLQRFLPTRYQKLMAKLSA